MEKTNNVYERVWDGGKPFREFMQTLFRKNEYSNVLVGGESYTESAIKLIKHLKEENVKLIKDKNNIFIKYNSFKAKIRRALKYE